MSSIDYHDILRQADAAFSSVEGSNHHDGEQIVTVTDDQQHLSDADQMSHEGTADEFMMLDDPTLDQHTLHQDLHAEHDQEQVVPSLLPESSGTPSHPLGMQEQTPEAGTSTGRTKGLTSAEKKDRQRAQNRKAAEKSRNKKKNEQMALEVNVNNMQEENQRLRARLQSLMASRPSHSPVVDSHHPLDPVISSPTGITTSISGTGIDYTYISRLQNELTNAKTMLLERSMALARLKQGLEPTIDEQHVTRVDVLGHMTRVAGLHAEMAGIQTVLLHVKAEKHGLDVQRAKVARELEERKIATGDIVDVRMTEIGDCPLDELLYQSN